MSAVVVTLHTEATEVPAVIAGSVNLLRFTEALAGAGIVGRFDPDRGVLVIQPAPERCRACGGTGLDDDAKCEFCDGRAELPQETTQERRPDAWVGMGWYNRLTRLQPRLIYFIRHWRIVGAHDLYRV